MFKKTSFGEVHAFRRVYGRKFSYGDVSLDPNIYQTVYLPQSLIVLSHSNAKAQKTFFVQNSERDVIELRL